MKEGFDPGFVINFDDVANIAPPGITFDPLLAGDKTPEEEDTEKITELFRRHKDAPNDFVVLNSLGNALQRGGELSLAIEAHRLSLQIEPNHAIGLSNLGSALVSDGQFDAAIETLEIVHQARPDLADTEYNLAAAYLASGQLEKGWQHYGSRWKTKSFALRKPPKVAPAWDGTPFEGKLYLWAEQGLGDEILHGTMLRDFIDKIHADVIVEVDARLKNMFERAFPGVKIVPRESGRWAKNLGDVIDMNKILGGNVDVTPVVDADAPKFAMPFGSMGKYVRPTKESILGEAYLQAPKAMTEYFRKTLRDTNGGKMMVGLSWISMSRTLHQRKSLTLVDLQKILRLPNVEFIDLQYGDTSAERGIAQRMELVPPSKIRGVDTVRDMDGVAALAAACDCVLTVSNTVAHLCGAIGVPTITLLPEKSGRLWYWFAPGGACCPWYESLMPVWKEGPQWDSAINIAKTVLQIKSEGDYDAEWTDLCNRNRSRA